MSDTSRLYEFDCAMRSGVGAALLGIDEAGRGPLAGPVVAAAVCLDPGDPIDGIDDSKKLSAARRERLYEQIVSRARSSATGMATVEEIDRMNILQATLLAMRRAVEKIAAPWDVALVDGNREVPGLRGGQLTVIDGDALSASIAAASILAKVTRDRLMARYDREFPQYEFGRHKGYATARHLQILAREGPCPIHRRSFCRCRAAQTELELAFT